MYVQKYFVSINKQLLQNLVILMSFCGSNAGEEEEEVEEESGEWNRGKKDKTGKLTGENIKMAVRSEKENNKKSIQ